MSDALEKLTKALKGLEGQKAAPVEKWNPPFCGDLDIRIARDGLWYYMGTPIGRKPLVKLFASVLRKDNDGKTYLVTPVEKIGITVEDAHFLGIELSCVGSSDAQVLSIRTQTDEWITLGDEHRLWFEADPEGRGEPGHLIPYFDVRGRLTARIHRPVFYEMVELGQTKKHEGDDWFGIYSNGTFFPMLRQTELELLSSQ